MPRRLARFLETYRGSSFPTRVETTDGGSGVIKLRGSGNGAAALLSEFVVNGLAAAAGLPVPDVFVITIEAGHPWDYGTDEFYDLVRKSAGPNLGIALVPGARSLTPDECACLPREFVRQVVTLDTIFANVDRTWQSSNLVADARGCPWMLDQGSCRFLFQTGDRRWARLPGDHVLAQVDAEVDGGIVTLLRDAARQTGIVDVVPAEWLAEVGMERETLRRRLEEVLSRPGSWVRGGGRAEPSEQSPAALG